MRYRTLTDGEKLRIPTHKKVGNALGRCCSCKLTHRYKYEVTPGSAIEITAWRDARATHMGRRRNLNDLDLAYVAGFFDGEGSVMITDNYSLRGLAPNPTLRVSIGNTDPCVIKKLAQVYGGVYTIRRVNKQNHRNVAQWCVSTHKAVAFLRDIAPFVKMKRDQIALALKFQRSKKMRGKKRVPVEVVAKREASKTHMTTLNKRAWI